MFLTHLDERVYKPGEWALLAPLRWCSVHPWMPGVLLEFEAPRAYVTDHASIPRLLHGPLRKDGPSRRSGTGHDWLYCSKKVTLRYLTSGLVEEVAIERKLADVMLPIMMASDKCSEFSQDAYYAAVRCFGWRYWNKRKNGLQPDYDFAPDSFMNQPLDIAWPPLPQ